MIDVHIQTHADCIRRHEVVDLAALVHFDLGVTRPRAQRAEYHRRAAALTAHQFSNCVDLIDRKRDDCAAAR